MDFSPFEERNTLGTNVKCGDSDASNYVYI